MMTSDFIPVRSGICLMNCSLSPVRMPASPDCMAAAAPEVTSARVAIGQLQHFSDAFSGGGFQIGDPHKVAAGLGHDRFELRAKNGTAETVMVPSQLMTVFTPKLLVWIAGLAEAAYLGCCLSRRKACAVPSANQQVTPDFPRNSGDSTRTESHVMLLWHPVTYAAFVLCLLTSTMAAMQLISTSELPGSAATATVVRAGPPLGK